MKFTFTSFDKAILAAILGPIIALAVSYLNGGTIVWPKDVIAAVVAGVVAGVLVYLKGNAPTASPALPKSQSGQIGMGLLARLVLAVVVGVVVYLLCLLFGPLVADLKASFAVTVGSWLTTYAGVLGLLAALWFFFSGGGLAFLKRP